MSYILDALKKSEQARGGRTTRKEFEELPESPALNSMRPQSSRRWLYCIAFIVFANISVLIFRAAPRRRAAIGEDAHKVRTTRSDAGAASKNRMEAGDGKKIARSDLKSSAHAACKPAEAAKISRAHNRTHPQEKTRSLEPVAPLPAPKNRGAKLAAAHKPVEPVGGLGARKAQTANSLNSRKARQTELDSKVAYFEALLAKQAEEAQKSAPPALNREDRADAGGSTEPAITNTPGPGVYTMNRLPLTIRQSLPDLSVSMLVFSTQLSERFIYVNGFKRHEGDEISRGLKLERITREGAIFNYMGRRFYKSVIGD
ncbi:MAG: general secretion pathway protein GspB [Syntrophobacteraceae bacterium]